MQLRPGRSSRVAGRLHHVGGSGEGPWVTDIAKAAHRIDAVPIVSSPSRSALLRGSARGRKILTSVKLFLYECQNDVDVRQTSARHALVHRGRGRCVHGNELTRNDPDFV